MNRSHVRRRAEKEQRREQIVDAAETVFMRIGFGAAKVEDVAKEAQVSRALVYLYFRNKEELYFAICVRALSAIRERFIAAASTAKTGYDQLRAIGREYVAFATDCPGQFSALSHLEAHQPAEVAPDSVERKALDAGKAVHAITIAAIEQGRRDGSIRDDIGDPLMAALSLWGFSHGTIQLAMTKRHFFADIGVNPAQFTEAALQLALRGLAPTEPSATPSAASRKRR